MSVPVSVVNIIPEITPDDNAGGRINIADISPDINQDGVVEPIEQQIYDRLKAADTDNDGYLSRKEMFNALKVVTLELKAAKAGAIPITLLNPDTDGDGRVQKWEVEVFERIKEADADKSGSIDVKELFGVIKGAAESDRQKRLFRLLFAGALVLLLIMLFANMGLTFAVVFLAKDTKASGAGELTTLSGGAIKTNGVAAYGLIWDLPTIETATLATLKSVTLDADLKTATAGTNWPSKMQATFEVAAATKPTIGATPSTTEAFLTLVGGGWIYLNKNTQGGSLTMNDGTQFTLGTQSPGNQITPSSATTGSKRRLSLGRHLAEGVKEYDWDGNRRVLFTAEELTITDPHTGRRKLGHMSFSNTAALNMDSSTATSVTTTNVTTTAATPSTCNDQCMYKGDDDCDDGGPGSEYSICQSGSDCSDCGPRATALPPPTPPPVGKPPPSPQPPGGCVVPQAADAPLSTFMGVQPSPSPLGSVRQLVSTPVPTRRLVVGGRIDAAYSLPYAVTIGRQKQRPDGSVDVNNYQHVCGGSLIGPTRVLTSASCVQGIPTQQLQVGVYRDDISKRGQEENICSKDLAVAQMTLHPSYMGTTKDYDIAILTLLGSADCAVSTNINFMPSMLAKLDGAGAEPSLLDTSPTTWSGTTAGTPGSYPMKTYTGVTATVSGWGSTVAPPMSGVQAVRKLMDSESHDHSEHDHSGHDHDDHHHGDWHGYSHPGTSKHPKNPDAEGGKEELYAEVLEDGRVKLPNGTEFPNYDAYRAKVPPEDHRCGTRHTEDDDDAEYQDLVARVTGNRRVLQAQGDPIMRARCTANFNNPHETLEPSIGDVLQINVVVHIVRTTDGLTGEISDDCIRQGIVMLNKDFRPNASDHTFKGRASIDTRIEFVLATSKPDGTATNGIVRYSNSQWYNCAKRTTCINGGLYGNSWDAKKYLNIFLKNPGGQTLGYATLPFGSAGTLNDAVVQQADVWGPAGTCATSSQYNQGGTLTHEVGHYLGLSHTFGSVGGTSCGATDMPMCAQTGDTICDTAPAQAAIYTCEDKNSCGNSDPFNNYMDYSNDYCLNTFTRQQAMRMRCSLLGYRASIFQTIPSGIQGAPSPPYSKPLASPPPLEFSAPQCKCNDCGRSWSMSGVTVVGCANPDNDPNGNWCRMPRGCLKNGATNNQGWMYCNAATACPGPSPPPFPSPMPYPPNTANLPTPPPLPLNSPPPGPPPPSEHSSSITCLPQLTQDACQSFYPGFNKDVKVCFGSLDGGYDACGSDAGGPLVIPDAMDGRSTQVGIVSYGNGCALAKSPTVYTKVSKFVMRGAASQGTGDGTGTGGAASAAWIFSVAPEIECMHTCPTSTCTNLPPTDRNYTSCGSSGACMICNAPGYAIAGGG